jgi:NDP-sugar pyrophosphorylase family protein
MWNRGLKNKNFNLEQIVDTAMILAAGLGSRLKPWTDYNPKALLPVNGKSLLQRNIEYLQGFGIRNIVVNVHHFADQIVAAIEENKGWGSKVVISSETEAVLETGGGLLHARNLLPETGDFVLINCDILTNLKLNSLITAHRQNKALATLAVSNRVSSRYLLGNLQNRLIGWCNEKTGETKLPVPTPATGLKKMAFSGIQVIDSAIFDRIPLTGKFSLIDLYLELCRDYPIQTFDHSADLLLDVGKPESIVIASEWFP